MTSHSESGFHIEIKKQCIQFAFALDSGFQLSLLVLQWWHQHQHFWGKMGARDNFEGEIEKKSA